MNNISTQPYRNSDYDDIYWCLYTIYRNALRMQVIHLYMFLADIPASPSESLAALSRGRLIHEGLHQLSKSYYLSEGVLLIFQGHTVREVVCEIWVYRLNLTFNENGKQFLFRMGSVSYSGVYTSEFLIFARNCLGVT